MKQFTTEKQLTELTNQQSLALWSWVLDHGYDGEDGSLHLSIGQMIEFLGLEIIYVENEADWWGVKTLKKLNAHIEPAQYPELCDALWEEVKRVLEQK